MTALRRVGDGPPPRLIEITRAPRSASQVMQLATSEVVPEPDGPESALQIASGELNATPATPMRLLAIAAIVPATWVPWPLSSGHVPAVMTPAAARPQLIVLPARSGCADMMPVSTIPTRTPPVRGNAA